MSQFLPHKSGRIVLPLHSCVVRVRGGDAWKAPSLVHDACSQCLCDDYYPPCLEDATTESGAQISETPVCVPTTNILMAIESISLLTFFS